jgi:hypothetical protein
MTSLSALLGVGLNFELQGIFDDSKIRINYFFKHPK